MKSPKAAVPSAPLATSLEDVRLRIVRLQDERADVERQPVTEAAAVDRLTTWCASLRSAALARFDVTRFMAPAYRDPLPRDFADLMLGLLAPEAVEVLSTEIRTLYGRAAGIGDAERAARLAELDAQILAEGLVEEGLIRRAEGDGYTVLRRADADPRAVLARSEELP